VPEAEFHVGGERLACGWAEHQVRATVDFAPSNRLLRWYLGGLNYQVEHHLFPDVCHQHHPALARIVDATCAEYRIPLHRTPTLGAALAAHHHFLRAMGRAGTRPAAAPSLVSAIRSESRT
jgi:linoleoyl-CoA desaturase